MEANKVWYGKWYLEKPKVGGGFDLYKMSPTEVYKDKQKTGEFRDTAKNEGFNMPIGMVVSKIANDDAFDESSKLEDMLEKIYQKQEEVTEKLIKQLKSE